VAVNRHTVGAVLVGAYGYDGRLMFCGVVGTGLNTAERRRLTDALKPLQRSTSPFTSCPSNIAPHALWVHAEMVGDVEYRDFRGSFRHPSRKGLRGDLVSNHVELPA
jgi:bifunctional non-homologous end joining protein LigD